MRKSAACLMIAASMIGVFGNLSMANAQVITVSDRVNTTITLTTVGAPFETFTLPEGSTIAPPLNGALPSFLTPVQINFGLVFPAVPLF